jgi:hypothetical protein
MRLILCEQMKIFSFQCKLRLLNVLTYGISVGIMVGISVGTMVGIAGYYNMISKCCWS